MIGLLIDNKLGMVKELVFVITIPALEWRQ
jgi:hypothetical protein